MRVRSWWSCLALLLPEKTEEEDADEDEEDQHAGHPAQQRLQRDRVEALLGARLWFLATIKISHLT